MGLGAMSLNGSNYSTPRSVAGGLPDEEEESAERGRADALNTNAKEKSMEEVKIVGMDVEVGGEGESAGPGKMDVDP